MKMDIETMTTELNIDRSNWSLTTFGEVAIQQKESVDRENTDITRYVKGEHMCSEDLHLRDWGELKDEYLGPAFIRRFEEGDILYGSRRTYLRKVCIAPFEGITSNTTFVIKANEELIDKSLLPFVMLSEGFSEHSIRNSKGSVNPYVNWKDLAGYEFLLPPKVQQAQLAELLWSIDDVVENGVKVHKGLEVFLSCHIGSFFKDRKCTFEALDDHADIKYGITLNSKRKNHEVSAPYLRVANVARDSISMEEVKLIGATETEIEKYSLRTGDVLIVEGHADIKAIGRCAIWSEEKEGMLHQNHLIRVRATQRIKSEVISAYINSSYGQGYFQRNAKSTSTM